MNLYRICISLIVLFSCSTPYFNAFYHAEKSFEKGVAEWKKKQFETREEEELVEQTFTNTDLKNAIEKCQYILERFGVHEEQNSYAPDAYLMISRASFYLEDYETAITSAELLEKNNPNSQLLSEALLIKGNAFLKLGKYDLAKDAFKSIPLKLQNLSIVAQSKLSTAKILVQDQDVEEAIQVLEATLEYEKQNEFDISYEEEIRFELVDLLTRLLENNSSYVKLLNYTKDVFEYENIKYKLILAEKRINALIELNQTELFRDYIDELSEDDEFMLQPDFIDYLNLKYKFHTGTDISSLESDLTNYALLHQTSTHHYKVNLLKTRYLLDHNYTDSALVIYKSAIGKIRNTKDKKYHTAEYNKISRNLDLVKKADEYSNALVIMDHRLDSLKGIVTDTVYNELLVKRNELNEKRALNDYAFGVFYFDYKRPKLAKPYFQSYVDIGSTPETIASALIHIAYIEEEKNPVLADSLFRYVYHNYDSFKQNEGLIAKLNISDIERLNKNTRIYRNFLQNVEDKNLSLSSLNDQIKYTKSLLDSSAIEHEYIDFYRIHYLISDESKKRMAIPYIKQFKEAYPSSAYLDEIKHFIVDQDVFDKVEERERIKKERANQPKLLSEIKEEYITSIDSVLTIEIDVTPSGHVSSVDVGQGITGELKQFILDIVTSWKFEPSEEHNTNRLFYTELVLRREKRKEVEQVKSFKKTKSLKSKREVDDQPKKENIDF